MPPHEFTIELEEKRRRYVFRPLPNGSIRIRRWEDRRCTNERVLTKDDAKRLWRWMTTYLGYKPQQTDARSRP